MTDHENTRRLLLTALLGEPDERGNSTREFDGRVLAQRQAEAIVDALLATRVWPSDDGQIVVDDRVVSMHRYASQPGALDHTDRVYPCRELVLSDGSRRREYLDGQTWIEYERIVQ